MDNNKPFDKYYILRITSMHMKKAIEKSLSITIGRMKDVPADKQKEVFETIQVLDQIKRIIVEFEKNNEHLYNNPKNINKDNK